ncbi:MULTISPECIES: cation:proton antiporter [unclassified Variovorax]|uniref:cation:proton antiporter n=1 Tax=unclassified Variovorax TaxID=663243 RepID=UPI00076DC3A3|nr:MULTISPECIES: sodium:proton antiporter [unclassified Variovorax]KWT95565.1 putative Na+/H+ antiporter [Variovorax sp. WDL1]PNG50175.1 Na(+)/H(+) antiporter NhaP [Variovorax sp. B2]PNG51048.1 Na(+)/H(+) antiporter NhaP [Variovorax sp. B4]VTU42213.1 Sodium, potassium, lithium and rubidium/H(+) antiporter [Variovorax sp. SRS16]VTU42243.1 Sodium, potassium, lithium and rubidium/H(+) antiporter [Variovorax sp. PBL-E5]
MTAFQGAGLLFTVISVFGVINHRYLKLPDTLGITAVGLMLCLGLSILGTGHPEMVAQAQKLVTQIDFSEVVFHGLLSLLLFAGALHVDVSRLRAHRAPVFLLATVGVVISTAVVGFGLYLVASLFGSPISLLWCLVFGALISPTDPIAVLSVLKSAGAPPALESKIAGEALFNDGTAVVTFVTLLGLAAGTTHFSLGEVAVTLAREVIGALLLGVAVGYGASLMVSRVESYPVEILITLAVATAGYSLAELLHVSAPLAVVIMGLVLGSHGATKSMTAKTREHLFNFWSLLDELLNLLLFGLIGLQMIAVSLKANVVYLGLAAIPVVLTARFLSVAAPLSALRGFHAMSPHAAKVMTWGGLRGGISIALALSLPVFEGRDLIIGVTYIVVVFSLLVQATTLGPLVKRLGRSCSGE